MIIAGSGFIEFVFTSHTPFQSRGVDLYGSFEAFVSVLRARAVVVVLLPEDLIDIDFRKFADQQLKLD